MTSKEQSTLTPKYAFVAKTYNMFIERATQDLQMAKKRNTTLIYVLKAAKAERASLDLEKSRGYYREIKTSEFIDIETKLDKIIGELEKKVEELQECTKDINENLSS